MRRGFGPPGWGDRTQQQQQQTGGHHHHHHHHGAGEGYNQQEQHDPNLHQQSPPQQDNRTFLSPPQTQGQTGTLQQLFPNISMSELMKILKANNYNVQAAITEVINGMTSSASQSPQAASYQQQSMWQDTHPTQSFFNYNPNAPSHSPLAPPETGFYASENFAPNQVRPARGTRKSLLIGINYLGTKNQLDGCCEDVKRIQKLLESVYGFPTDEFHQTVLIDERGDPKTMPTKRNMLAAMQWLVHGAQPGDVLFFHYSGHGSQQHDQTGTEIDGFDETILPLDFLSQGIISDDELHTTLIKPLESGVKLVAVLDCCHSGSGMDLPYYLDPKKRDWEVEYNPFFVPADVTLISSCQDCETAADVNLSSFGKGGALTLALVSTLAQNPFNMPFPTLMDEMATFLKSRSLKQRPQLSVTQKFPLSTCLNFTEVYDNMEPKLGRGERKTPKANVQRSSHGWGGLFREALKQMVGAVEYQY